MASGKFIAFEGGEGCGKSTQARLLADRLAASGLTVISTREPGGTPFAERVREVLLGPSTPPHSALAEALLFYAARTDHIEKLIRPELDRGHWVVTDRFSDSTRVYQGIAGTVPAAAIETLERLVVGATCPDLTVIVDVLPEVGLKRAADRRGAATAGASPAIAVDPYERRDLAYHERLRAGFLALAGATPGRYAVIDGTKPAAEVAEAVWRAVAARLLVEAR